MGHRCSRRKVDSPVSISCTERVHVARTPGRPLGQGPGTFSPWAPLDRVPSRLGDRTSTSYLSGRSPARSVARGSGCPNPRPHPPAASPGRFRLACTLRPRCARAGSGRRTRAPGTSPRPQRWAEAAIDAARLSSVSSRRTRGYPGGRRCRRGRGADTGWWTSSRSATRRATPRGRVASCWRKIRGIRIV